MFDKRVSKYLVKINKGEAINLAKFLLVLPESIQDEVRNHATVKCQKGGLSIVNIHSDELKAQLAQLTIEPKCRIEATTQGNSHKVTTSTSFFYWYTMKSVAQFTLKQLLLTKQEHIIYLRPKRMCLLLKMQSYFFSKNTIICAIKSNF